jgi:hypothetical protein
MKGEHRRADLLKLLVAESWHTYDIPVLKLPNLLVAQGAMQKLGICEIWRNWEPDCAIFLINSTLKLVILVTHIQLQIQASQFLKGQQIGLSSQTCVTIPCPRSLDWKLRENLQETMVFHGFPVFSPYIV